jgi:Ca2+-binding EF-hand superfamily protein
MSKKSLPPQSNKALPPKASVNPKSPLQPVSKAWCAEDYVSESVSLEQVKQCKVAFDIFDNDGSGVVDPVELKNAFISLGFANTNKLIYRIINDLDV